MGFFDKILGKGGATQAPTSNMVGTVPTTSGTAVSTSASSMTIDMSKRAEKLETVLIDMSKSGKTNMTKHIARVAVVEDYTGSMAGMYRDGTVQEVTNRLLPIALKFDDNGEMESWIFANSYRKLAPVTIDNHEDYVENVIMRSGMNMGGTYYAPVLRDIVKFYKNSPSNIPALVIFITDGDNFDEYETSAIIRELSNYNMFVQFVGIGNQSDFDYLRELDNLSGRKCDNTGFLLARDLVKMDDERLYTELLRQYNDWLNSK